MRVIVCGVQRTGTLSMSDFSPRPRNSIFADTIISLKAYAMRSTD